MSYLIEKYIRDNVKNPELSDVRTIQSGLVSNSIEVSFENQNVAMIIGTNLVFEDTNAAGDIVLTDASSSRIVASRSQAGFPNGILFAGLFFYIWNSNRLSLVGNNVNYLFRLQYQLVYGNREKSTDAR